MLPPKPVISSPFFKAAATCASAAAKTKRMARIPLKETPKYRKILQVVDSDTSSDNNNDNVSADADVIVLDDSDEDDASYKVSATESSSSSDSADSYRSGRRQKRRLKKAAATKPRNKFDFSQIASSESDSDEDTIFIDKDKIVGAVDVGTAKKTAPDGKRKLFSDVNYNTPTSCEEEERVGTDENNDGTRKREKDREIHFPWLQFTPTNRRLDSIKRQETPLKVSIS